MPIARNKKNPPVNPDAIAAFGAAAEARPATPEPPAPSAPAKARAPRSAAPSVKDGEEKAPPKSSLVRWAGEEETRDRLLAYSAAERYKMQDLMVKAMQLGMDQLEGR